MSAVHGASYILQGTTIHSLILYSSGVCLEYVQCYLRFASIAYTHGGLWFYITKILSARWMNEEWICTGSLLVVDVAF